MITVYCMCIHGISFVKSEVGRIKICGSSHGSQLLLMLLTRVYNSAEGYAPWCFHFYNTTVKTMYSQCCVVLLLLFFVALIEKSKTLLVHFACDHCV